MTSKANILNILASHPVQYQTPLWQQLALNGWQVETGYYYRGAAGKPVFDIDFGIEFQWDIELLNGYYYHIFSEKLASYTLLEQFKIAPQLIFWALKNPEAPLLLTGWFTEIIWLIWLLRIVNKSPVIMFCETTPLSFWSTPKPRWRVALLRWLLQHRQTVNLFIGSRNRAFLEEMGVKDEHLFPAPYSIDNDQLFAEVNRALPQRIELCQQYGLDPSKPVFLFCGKLIEKKRPLQLLDAYVYAGLEKDAQLLYIGEGKLRPQLEDKIKTLGLVHVHLLGFLNQTQMPLAYVLGELLCLISDPTETWGLVINEALACGRPVIVSDVIGCAPDLVSSDVGWVTPLDNLPALSRSMRLAYDQRESWHTMGRAGREKVSKNTFPHMVAGIQSAVEYINTNINNERR